MLEQIRLILSEEIFYRRVRSSYRKTNRLGSPSMSMLVNGSPKTGTTWLVKLISSVPGFRYVGNFKGDLNLYGQVHPGDLIHGHHFYSEKLNHYLQQKNTKVVLTLRDPRDQTVSRMFHVLRDTSHPYHTELCKLDADQALMACIEGREKLPGTEQMIQLTQSWTKSEAGYFPVYYEKLLLDSDKELTGVFDFLQLPVDPDFIHAIVQRNRFERLSIGFKFWKPIRQSGEADPNSHVRKGISGDWKNYFKPAHIESFKRCAGEQLVEFGYEEGYDW